MVAIFALCIGHAGFAFKRRDPELEFVEESSSDSDDIQVAEEPKFVHQESHA